MNGGASADFPKSARLRKRAEFTALAACRNKRAVAGFLVVWQINDREEARLGITASRKVGCSVVRNRVKRCLREYFRHNRSTLPAVDINVIVRRESVQMTYADMVRELNKAFQNLGK